MIFQDHIYQDITEISRKDPTRSPDYLAPCDAINKDTNEVKSSFSKFHCHFQTCTFSICCIFFIVFLNLFVVWYKKQKVEPDPLKDEKDQNELDKSAILIECISHLTFSTNPLDFYTFFQFI